MKPIVSVVMTAYNGGEFVGEAVDSILAQDMPDLELIVIDDGSTDGTAGVVEAMADPRIRLVRNPCNQGIAASANVGLALARGDFIARMDCDDIALPDRLSAQLAFLEANPRVDVLGGGIEIFGAAQAQADAPPADGDIKANFLAARGNIYNPTSCFRRSLVDRFRLRYNPSLNGPEDLAFWVDAMRAGASFANLDRTLLRYRWHGGNISASSAVPAEVETIRRPLIRDLFPQLTGYEAGVLASAFAGVRQPRAIVAEVIKRAAQPVPSVYGENRARLVHHLDRLSAKLVPGQS